MLQFGTGLTALPADGLIGVQKLICVFGAPSALTLPYRPYGLSDDHARPSRARTTVCLWRPQCHESFAHA